MIFQEFGDGKSIFVEKNAIFVEKNAIFVEKNAIFVEKNRDALRAVAKLTSHDCSQTSKI